MSNQRTARSGQSGRRATNMEQTFKDASPGSLLGENVARLDAARFVRGASITVPISFPQARSI
jgi:carbon-monoxide dehydrogenase large subunit